jgi:hypothetical protein
VAKANYTFVPAWPWPPPSAAIKAGLTSSNRSGETASSDSARSDSGDAFAHHRTSRHAEDANCQMQKSIGKPGTTPSTPAIAKLDGCPCHFVTLSSFTPGNLLC